MHEAISLVRLDPTHDDARSAVERYFAEISVRIGAEIGPDRVDADAPQMRPPKGAFVVAYRDGNVAGCGGLRRIEPIAADPAGTVVSEIKRMWVDSSARGHGLGSRLLAELEDVAWKSGATVVRLDTDEHLVEAIAMYRRRGYVDIEPYNEGVLPTHWFEKLRPTAEAQAPVS